MLNEAVKRQIIQLLEQEQLFKEKNLLVSDLSKKLEISVRELPLYFRHFFDSDFKTMVNDYRVCLARKKMEEGYLDDFTVEALGDSCGFSSRTTFFNAFKKKYEKSPSEYRRFVQENSRTDSGYDPD